MTITTWFIVAGAVLCGMALTATLIKRLPLTTALVYLPLGWILGSHNLHAIDIDLRHDAWLIQMVAQVVILISLFASGLKVRLPLKDRLWRICFRLAFVSMVLTILLIATGCVLAFHLSWGMGIVVGAMLAPTDPVLASEVEIESPYKTAPLRFALTSEAGLNDGGAFPFIVLGLALLRQPADQKLLAHWVVLNLFWGTLAGLLVGWGTGVLLGRYVLHLRRVHQQAIGLGYFIAPGIIALSYGLGELAHGYGFLSVFAAAVALRALERHETGEQDVPVLPLVSPDRSAILEVASDPEKASLFLVELLLQFTGQMEQMGEIVVVVIVGALLREQPFVARTILSVLVLFIIIRPVSTWISLLGIRLGWRVKALISWFGIRGIGSLYYLAYVAGRHLSSGDLARMTNLVITAIAMSIVLHGASVSPLMNTYSKKWAKTDDRQLEEAA